jgi:hypothetical protein
MIDIISHQYDFSADETIVRIEGQSEEEKREGDVDYSEVAVSGRIGLAYTF